MNAATLPADELAEPASHAIRHGLVAVPVAGPGGRVLGVVPPQAPIYFGTVSPLVL